VEERDALFVKVVEGPKHVRLATLSKLMELWDFDMRTTKKGDNVLFWHKGFADVRAAAAVPHHGPVLVTYVRDCIAAIEEVKRLEDATDG
jgi:hypothetical protein